MKRQITAAFLGAALLFSTVVPAFAAIETSKDSGLLWLVNYEHPVASGYVASDMRSVNNSSIKMRGTAAVALEKMIADMKSAGYSIRLNSGYRSYATQTYLFNTRLKSRQDNGMSYDVAHAATRKFTAVPGTSEHQLGLAMDLSTDGTLTAAFADTAQGKWLEKNCWRYGYILRYDEKKYNYTQIGEEPWHFRYVGAPHAQLMYEKGWCFEEYINYLKEKKQISLTAGDMVYEVFRTEGGTSGYQNVIDVSSDNSGGMIITTYHAVDPMKYISGHWSEKSFVDLFGGNVPKSFGVINPAAAITRGEFAGLYALLLPSPPASPSSPAFSDVPASHPHYKAITTVAAAEVMNGNRNMFRPGGLLTREEAAVAAASSVEGSNLQYLGYMDVGDISGWAFQSIQKLAYHQLMNGSEGKFRPSATLNWGEAAALLCKLKEHMAQ